MTKRKILFALFVAATVINSFAAGNGMAGINEATSMVSGYFDPGTKLVYAIGAVVGLIGGIKVYSSLAPATPTRAKPPHRGSEPASSLSWPRQFSVPSSSDPRRHGILH